MVALVLMFAVASMVGEYMLVKRIPELARLLERPLVSLGFSLVLSILLGMVFGAAGLIVMLGGLISTVCMQPYYKFKAWRRRP